jgi:hypothetical protein
MFIQEVGPGQCYDSTCRVKLSLSTVYESATIDYYLSIFVLEHHVDERAFEPLQVGRSESFRLAHSGFILFL